MVDINQRVEVAQTSFKYAFFDEDSENEIIIIQIRDLKFRFGRMHLGSYMAFGMAFYNLHQLQQRIIKQSIHFTKSKNPNVIKFTKGYLNVLYFVGLATIWHIPSLSSELAFKLYFSTATATYNFLNSSQSISQSILSDQNIQEVLNDLETTTIE